MEIWLDCPWYKHPFPKNRFKLISTKQIEIIRQLKLQDIYCHSASYRAAAEPDLTKVPSFLDEPAVAPAADWIQIREAQAPLQDSLPLDLRHDVKQAHTVYRDTLRKSSDCLRQIIAGQEAGADGASALVKHFVDELLKSESSVALVDVLHLNVIERVQAAHALNTCILALLVGRELELEPEELKVAGLAGLLHDLGEQRIPSQIRWKAEPLTRAEKSLFQLHPLYGKELLQELPGIPEGVGDIVGQHHESINGTGYPRRLTDEQIHPLAKILRVVDEYQYLTNPREPHVKLQPNQALAELYVKRQQQLSVKVIIALVRVVSVYPPGTIVELTDGSIGIVLNTSSCERLRPMVMAYERKGSEFDTHLIDLHEQRQLSIRRIVESAELAPDLAQRITPAEALNYLMLSAGTKQPNGTQPSSARSSLKG
jgi:HD-GYP domain-containing protein (c-di-GMP phosphodiesterase class II)